MLFNEYYISGFINNSDLNEKIKTLATKAELKSEQDKRMKLKTHDLSYLLGKIFVGDDGFQNMLVYQPTPSKLQLKKICS